MSLMCSMVGGESFRVECSHYEGKAGEAHPALKGSVILSIRTNDGEFNLHLTHDKAARIETAIAQCLRDRAAMLANSANDDDEVDIVSADDADQSIRDGMTDADRKAMNDFGGSVGY